MALTPKEANDWRIVLCLWLSYIIGAFGFCFSLVFITDVGRLTIALGASVSLLGGPSVFKAFTEKPGGEEGGRK